MIFLSNRHLLSDREVLEKLLENCRMSVIVIDSEARVSGIGGDILNLLPFSKEDCLGKTIDEIFAFDPGFAGYYHRALQGKQDKTVIINNQSQIEVHFEPIRNERGEITGAVGFDHILVDQERVLQTHQEREEQLANLLNNSLDGIFLLDRDLVIKRANTVAETMYNGGRSLAGQVCYRQLHGRNEVCENCPVAEAIRTKKPASTQWFDGTVKKHLFLYAVPLLDAKSGEVIGAFETFRDISQTIEYAHTIKSQDLLVNDLFSSIRDGVFIIDSEYTILRANPAFEAVQGQGKPVVGRKCYEISALDKPCPHCEVDRVFRNKETANFIHRQAEDDPLLPGCWFEHFFHPVVSEEGEVTAAVSIVRDITDRQAAEEALKAATAKAKEASIAKSQFLATMSHEIRTPLNGVIGLTDLLLHTGLNRRQKEYAELAQASGKYLLSLINDILDLSKIEAGKLEIVEAPFDLIEMAESVLGILAARAQDGNLELCGLFLSELPRHVIGDGDRIRQILVNFIGNAVKFTEQGGIKLVVSPRTWIDHGKTRRCHVRFDVIDTGIGVPKDRVDRLFQSFSQIDASHDTKYGGTGLGLAISKELVHLMGGEIGYIRNEHGGSTFWFTAPLQVESLAAKKTPVFSHGSLEFKNVRVLAVDENIVLRKVLHRQLSEWGMSVDLATSKSAALSALRNAAKQNLPYRIVVIDSGLEDAPGAELAEQILADAALKGTGLILLTPLSRESNGDSGIYDRVDKVVVKPLIGSALFNAVLGVLTGREIEGTDSRRFHPKFNEAVQAQGSFLSALNDFSKEKDISELTRHVDDSGIPAILVAEDNRVNQIVVSEILVKLGYRVEIVGNGQKACEAVAAKAFSLILMDCEMPVMDGFRATETIRRMERGEETKTTAHEGRIPIVALTANAIEGVDARCLEAGMDAYCSKPIQADKLNSVLKRWIADENII